MKNYNAKSGMMGVFLILIYRFYLFILNFYFSKDPRAYSRTYHHLTTRAETTALTTIPTNGQPKKINKIAHTMP